MLLSMLLSCGKTSNMLTTQMVSAIFHQLINCIGTETDPSFLSIFDSEFVHHSEWKYQVRHCLNGVTRV